MRQTLWLSLATATALVALPQMGRAQGMAPQQVPAEAADPGFGNSVLRQIIQMQLNSRGGLPVGAPGAESEALLGNRDKKDGAPQRGGTGAIGGDSFANSPQFGISSGSRSGQ